MLTIMFHVTVKKGCEDEFYALSQRLTTMTRQEDAGCITYRFHRRQGSNRDFLLYEQWQDEASLRAHLEHLQREMGPAEDGESLPPALLNLCESTQPVMYEVVMQ